MSDQARQSALSAVTEVLARHTFHVDVRAHIAAAIVDELAAQVAAIPWILTAGVIRRAEGLKVYGRLTATPYNLPRSVVDDAVTTAAMHLGVS